MAETKMQIIERLIIQNKEARDQLLEQVRSFEYMPGLGEDGRDITQQWLRRLKRWIDERESLIADLEAVRAGKRDTI